MYTPTKQYLKKIKRIKNRLLNGEYILGEMKWSFDVYDVYECSGISPFILGTWMSTNNYGKCFCFYWDSHPDSLFSSDFSCCKNHSLFSECERIPPNKYLSSPEQMKKIFSEQLKNKKIEKENFQIEGDSEW